MSNTATVPTPRFTVLTLGVSDMRSSIAFYESLGFTRKFRATGEEVAFFETGGTVLGLFPWHLLAADASLPDQPRPAAFRGGAIAWNCRDDAEVDAVMAFALSKGAKLLKPAQPTSYGGYCGYFADLDGHAWEVVRAPGFEVRDDGRVSLPD
ncbi:VOC family protein [Bradyrhizobium sp. ISRA443]|uniref:VOC family protein n=1 Tax=unclassified Bradyrhizobium TaxID=2631580 RepID=UPI00247A6137|nr:MULTISPECIES: VOC family protein [unclassified Bradyrhizobium]WGR95691.1 VOC family protein [Bradyrhizobium sp. ISRA435]WGS00772.1 VOC family protein [Bradyrhizobium sp. ISRA436]WGS07659.1 VOC family protein [Bradyrhizobium sp. ISRA437]WGS14547.1 VOC family protein [Bradyrhizobium sp. ISRA443]